MAKPDPTKDPKFQQVVRTFLTTPHKPHKSAGKTKIAVQKAASKKPRPKVTKTGR